MRQKSLVERITLLMNNQPWWRTEPEIDAARQQFLGQRLMVVVDIYQGVYPFKDIRLTRADVEWLLANHEQGRGPVDCSDATQSKRQGIDERGVDRDDIGAARAGRSSPGAGGLKQCTPRKCSFARRVSPGGHITEDASDTGHALPGKPDGYLLARGPVGGREHDVYTP